MTFQAILSYAQKGPKKEEIIDKNNPKLVPVKFKKTCGYEFVVIQSYDRLNKE